VALEVTSTYGALQIDFFTLHYVCHCVSLLYDKLLCCCVSLAVLRHDVCDCVLLLYDKLLCCYVSLAQLHDEISSQTNISSSDQFILFENHELRDVVSDSELVSMFLHTSPSNPLYLFSVTDDINSSAVDSVPSAAIRKLCLSCFFSSCLCAWSIQCQQG